MATTPGPRAENFGGGDTHNYVAQSAASLKHGESYTTLGGVKVSYHSSPSYGDNGKKVPGATVGRYTIEYPNGRTSVHEHGPQANTDLARRRGANPNAKQLTAYRVHDEVSRHAVASANITRDGVFNDRRPAGNAGDDHPARLDDDSPQSKARCKDCGERITWNGPNHSDWAHV